MKLTDLLAPLRNCAGSVRTRGLDDDTVNRMAANFPDLGAAVRAAAEQFDAIKAEFAELVDADEQTQIETVQAGFINFYADDAVNPYLAIAARGPWVVTLKGAVLHDSGGYGMLGFGHTPANILEVMAQPKVMANVMSPSLSQLRITRALRAEIGHTRGNCPYPKFLCLNSGSESVSLAGRIADVNAKIHTDAGGPHAGRTIKRLAVKGAFHGRTERPALFSELLDKFAAGLPSDATLKYELIQRGFLPATAGSLVAVFRRSVEFARFFDYEDEELAMLPDELPHSTEQQVSNASSVDEALPTKPEKALPEEADIDRIPVRLPGGRRAWLSIPTPFYAADKERLKAQIDLLLTVEDEAE